MSQTSQTTPKALRLQVAIFGRVNAGKSSFLNLVTGQDVSITSEIEGTTTDIVEKSQELLPIGPITWLDTAGLGDTSDLADKRIEKSLKALDRADVVILVCEGDKIGEIEQFILDKSAEKKLPVIKIFNKKDKFSTSSDGISVNSLDKASRDEVLGKLKQALLDICPEEFIKSPPLLGDLAPKHSTVVMIIPIDFEAPKGRIILPQVQAIRDCLDNDQNIIVVKENGYKQILDDLKTPPALVVCDSQVVDFMVANTPKNIPCTTFSILFARLKGDLNKFVKGASAINKLTDQDKVLIAESCTHHAVDDDIGRVKIPKWLKEKTGKNLDINVVAGRDFPVDLEDYKLVVQCGGCMFGRREILARINASEQKRVPITNYGVCISELKDVLERVLEPFPDTLAEYRKSRNV